MCVTNVCLLVFSFFFIKIKKNIWRFEASSKISVIVRHRGEIIPRRPTCLGVRKLFYFHVSTSVASRRVSLYRILRHTLEWYPHFDPPLCALYHIQYAARRTRARDTSFISVLFFLRQTIFRNASYLLSLFLSFPPSQFFMKKLAPVSRHLLVT